MLKALSLGPFSTSQTLRSEQHTCLLPSRTARIDFDKVYVQFLGAYATDSIGIFLRFFEESCKGDIYFDRVDSHCDPPSFYLVIDNIRVSDKKNFSICGGINSLFLWKRVNPVKSAEIL